MKNLFIFSYSMFLLVLTGSPVFAEKYDIEKTYPISGSDEVHLISKFYEVKVNTSTDNQLKVIFNIEYDHIKNGTKEELEKSILEKFYRKNGNETSLDFSKIGMNGSSRINGDKVNFRSKSKHSMNVKKLDLVIQIYLPSTCRIFAITHFTDLSIASMKSPIEIEATNGKIKLGDAPSLKLNASFSDIVAGSFNTLNASITSTDLDFKSVKKVDLKSSFSHIDAENIEEFTFKGSSDDVRIEIVKNANLSSSFSNFKFDEITGSFSIKSSSDNVTIKNEITDFDQFKFKASFSNFDFRLSDKIEYTLSSNTTFTEIDLPESFTYQKRIQEFGDDREIEGYKGNSDAKSSIHIDCSSCNFEF